MNTEFDYDVAVERLRQVEQELQQLQAARAEVERLLLPRARVVSTHVYAWPQRSVAARPRERRARRRASRASPSGDLPPPPSRAVALVARAS